MHDHGGRRGDEGSGSDAGEEPTGLEEMLERIEEKARGGGRMSVRDVLDAVGSRSFGPLLLLPGLVMVAPLVGDIPGVPVLMGAVVVLTAGQLLLRRDHVWLPRWLLERSVKQETARKSLRWLRPVARVLDRWSRPRLRVLVHGVGTTMIALLCTALGLATPLMEVVPFSANVAGLAITACGLAVLVRDGLLTLIAVGASAGLVAMVVAGLT